MCFLPLKSSHYPSRPVPVPELFGKYPTRPVPKSKTPTRQTLSTTFAIYHDQEWQVFLKAIWADRSPWSRYLMASSEGFGTNRNDCECAVHTKYIFNFPSRV